jgi:hypothetical protein
MALSKFLLLGLLFLLTGSQGYAQQTRRDIFAGTQFPLQFTAGYQYQLHPLVSLRLQAGVMTHPLDKIFLYSMEQSGLKKELSNIIKESFDIGYLATGGLNFHYRKYYLGLNGQYVHLRGEGRLTEALYTYYKKDLPPIPAEFQPLLDGLQLKWQSHIWNSGILIGRKFLLPNPRLAIHTELGLTRTFSSTHSFASNNSFLDQTTLADEIYTRLDYEFKEAFRKYGYYPSVNLYVFYNF